MTPLLSVVIATCHRPAVLCRTLECLTPDRQQVSPGVFEVIVADDSRDAATRTVVGERFRQVHYIKGPGRGPASNRNRGAASAHYGGSIEQLQVELAAVCGALVASCTLL